MALHGDIRVNGRHIGEWEAQRSNSIGLSPGPDDQVAYKCMVRQDSTLEGNPAVLEQFEITHRFGDGAVALAAAVLAEGQRRANPVV